MKRVLRACVLLLALALLPTNLVWGDDTPDPGTWFPQGSSPPIMGSDSEPEENDGPRPPGDPDDITDGHRGSSENDGWDGGGVGLDPGDEIWLQLFEWLQNCLRLPY